MFCQNDRNEKLLFYRYTYQYFAALSVTGVNTYTTAEPLDNDTANVKSSPVPGLKSSTLVNRSNTHSCLSVGMPIPVSVMEITTTPVLRQSDRLM